LRFHCFEHRLDIGGVQHPIARADSNDRCKEYKQPKDASSEFCHSHYRRRPELANRPVRIVAVTIESALRLVGRDVKRLGSPKSNAATAAPPTALAVRAGERRTRSRNRIFAANILLSGSMMIAVS